MSKRSSISPSCSPLFKGVRNSTSTLRSSDHLKDALRATFLAGGVGGVRDASGAKDESEGGCNVGCHRVFRACASSKLLPADVDVVTRSALLTTMYSDAVLLRGGILMIV